MQSTIQRGGFFFAIFGALFQFISFILTLVFTVIKILWKTGLIQKFIKFTISSTIVLSIFGFFGVFVTAAGIIYFYIKQIMEIQGENKILRNYSRQAQGLPPRNN